MKQDPGPQSVSVLPDVIRMILAKRGYKKDIDIESFLYPNYEKDLHDPYLMTDMDLAVNRIVQAVELKQKIVIYGDYDIDGITASAVMIETIRNLGGEAISYIPDRFEEGYGINLAALKLLKKQEIDLVVTVDCGITSVSEAAWAAGNGLDLIITDHHTVPKEIPKAIAVVNPKRVGDKYPFKDLAGVGVAFKLSQALQQKTGKPMHGREKWLLDLVALGTVCDVVTLVGENRVLAKYGLVVMNKTKRAGLKALAKVSTVAIGEINSYHLGFIFGPRMNAAGRLEHAAQSLELMMTQEAGRSLEIAEELDRLNQVRRSDQARILEEANQQAKQYLHDPVLVLASPDWSHGIVGIVASKLVERWHKPTLVMQILGETTKGSARSCGDFNIVEGLRAVSSHLIKCGGHHYAAGYTLETSSIDQLRQALNQYYLSLDLEEVKTGKTVADSEIKNLAEVNDDLIATIDALEPFGNGNAKPNFESSLRLASVKRVGKEQNHLKLTLVDNEGRSVEAIGFDLNTKHPDLKEGQKVRAVFQAAKNEYNGRTSIQLIVSHLDEL